MKMPKPTAWTAALGGLISGTAALAAGRASQRMGPEGVAGTLVDWSFLIVGFIFPIAVLVVGPEYFRIGLRRPSIKEGIEAFAGVVKRVLLWFAVAGGILLFRGLLPLWLSS